MICIMFGCMKCLIYYKIRQFRFNQVQGSDPQPSSNSEFIDLGFELRQVGDLERRTQLKEELVNKLLDKMEKVCYKEYKDKFQQESAR